jgi:hypothetical protein
LGSLGIKAANVLDCLSSRVWQGRISESGLDSLVRLMLHLGFPCLALIRKLRQER